MAQPENVKAIMTRIAMGLRIAYGLEVFIVTAVCRLCIYRQLSLTCTLIGILRRADCSSPVDRSRQAYE